MLFRVKNRLTPPPTLQERCCGVSSCNRLGAVPVRDSDHSRTTRSATMIGIAPATLANPKSDTALGGAPGSKKLPAQIKTNNQHTKSMPVRGTPLTP